MRTYVYVDGFNLYYGCLKSSNYKWLNLVQLSKNLLPEPKNSIVKVKYFTAKVTAKPNDLDCHKRQYAYIRALKSLPEVEIFFGFYLSSVKWMPLASPQGSQKFAQVIKTEEKGSDVNIASEMLLDGFKDRFDCAVVISNDSDLARPIEIVRYELQKPVGVICPHEHPAKELKKKAVFYKKIRQGVLSASQFPPVVTDSRGSFHKPENW